MGLWTPSRVARRACPGLPQQADDIRFFKRGEGCAHCVSTPVLGVAPGSGDRRFGVGAGRHHDFRLSDNALRRPGRRGRGRLCRWHQLHDHDRCERPIHAAGAAFGGAARTDSVEGGRARTSAEASRGRGRSADDQHRCGADAEFRRGTDRRIARRGCGCGRRRCAVSAPIRCWSW